MSKTAASLTVAWYEPSHDDPDHDTQIELANELRARIEDVVKDPRYTDLIANVY